MLLRFKLLIILSGFTIANSFAQAGELTISTVGEFTFHSEKEYITPSIQTIDGEPYYVDVFKDSAVLTNIDSKKKYVYDLKPLQLYRHYFMALRFIEIDRCVAIHGLRDQLVIYDCKKKEKKVIQLNPFLRDKEEPSIGLFQQIPKMGNKLIIHIMDKQPERDTQAQRDSIFSRPPFIVYDLKDGKVTRPSDGKFWPDKYTGQYTFEDWAPTITHNDKNKIFLSFRQSNKIIEYDLKRDELCTHTVAQLDYLPDADSLSGGTMSQRREFNITNASIRNHIYHPELKQHFILVKDSSAFIVDDRIVTYNKINWKLLVLNRDFTLQNTQEIKMSELQWYMLGYSNKSILLAGALHDKDGLTYRPIKALKL